ncbi:class I SAM-dependent methyltransferase [Agromyces albus]|nr:class I SAM-dependent methyltransferase [Agromyces albus]
MHFDARADDYARARPAYPVALWDRIRDTGLIRRGNRALDLGAGTGQVTGPLLAAGMKVVAVEPGPRLAAALRSLHPDAEIVQARAEEYDAEEASFDLALAATSIHWMDLDSVLPIVHRALKPDGRFLVWRNVFGDPAAASTRFREHVQRIVDRRAAPPREGDPEDVSATSEALTRSGLFTVEDICTYRWDITLNEDQIRRLFGTFSDWSAGEVDEAAAAARELGGTIVEHYTSWLIVLAPLRHTARRAASSGAR